VLTTDQRPAPKQANLGKPSRKGLQSCTIALLALLAWVEERGLTSD